jgi:DNA-binding response OmpR family regulator
MRIWLDDERDPKDDFVQTKFGSNHNDVWAKTAQEAINLLETGKFSAISFDHDLGTDLSGLDVAHWIEKHAFERTISRLDWSVHSMNPIGKKNIESTMKNADKFWNTF